MNQRHRRFEKLLSLENVSEMRGFEWTDAALTIGGSVTLSEIERQVHGRLPLMEQLFPLFSSRLIRNRATLGGNLMTASPIGDSPPALLALDAEVELQKSDGQRWVSLADFFTGYRKTRAEAGEILTRVKIPLPAPPKQRFYKVSKRVLDDISTVAAGFSLRQADDGAITAARLAYGGVAATPVRATDAERVLEGKRPTPELLKEALTLLATAFQPLTDHRGSAEYRSRMVPKLFEKFWYEMLEGG
jgi:xanthine dehydrogenase small subunit